MTLKSKLLKSKNFRMILTRPQNTSSAWRRRSSSPTRLVLSSSSSSRRPKHNSRREMRQSTLLRRLSKERRAHQSSGRLHPLLQTIMLRRQTLWTRSSGSSWLNILMAKFSDTCSKSRRTVSTFSGLRKSP